MSEAHEWMPLLVLIRVLESADMDVAWVSVTYRDGEEYKEVAVSGPEVRLATTKERVLDLIGRYYT